MSSQSISLNESQSRISDSKGDIGSQNQVSRLNTIIQKNFEKKQQLGVHFSGIIQNASIRNSASLNVLYVIKGGTQWELLEGQTTGISQRAKCEENKTIWNFPFSVVFQTKTLLSWPQIFVVLYRTDYFGRSVAQAYGNLHLSRSEGKNQRKIRLFRPIQPKSFWNCINFCSSSLLEIKQPEKALNNDKNRSSLTVEYFGELNIEIQVHKLNFQKHGFQ